VATPMMAPLFWRKDVPPELADVLPKLVVPPELVDALEVVVGELAALISIAPVGAWLSVPELLGPGAGVVSDELGLVLKLVTPGGEMSNESVKDDPDD